MEYTTDSYGLESIACGMLCPATNITTDPNPISIRMPLMKITRPKRPKVFGHWILEHSLNVDQYIGGGSIPIILGGHLYSQS